MTATNKTGTAAVPMACPRALVLLTVVAAMLPSSAMARILVAWDFTTGLHGWQGNQHVEGMTVSTEGLSLRSTGIDPWIEGPAVDPSGEGMIRVRVRMRSHADPHGELFYGRGFQAGRSVRFTVQNDGRWHEYALWIAEPLGPGTRFRLDPAAGEGGLVIASIQIESVPSVQWPEPDRPVRPRQRDTEPLSIRSADLVLEHYQGGCSDFVVKVDGKEMAAGHQAEQIAVMLDDRPRWLRLSEADCTCAVENGVVRCEATLDGADGARWLMRRRFRPGPRAGTILVETEFAVDSDRDVLHLPWLTLLAGLETFNERKTQGLFAGLEYLADEPSSSEADITTPEHVRRVPDPVKLTFPLAALAHDGRYIGLIWEPSDMVAAVFDSPDRIYGSGAHVMALTAPAVGEQRLENALVAHTPFRLQAGKPLRIRATIIGGMGQMVVPAVRKYVELCGLPAVPQVEGGFDGAAKLLAHGWLDSAANEDGLFRHAVWGDSFRAQPAADAAMYIDWLANALQDRDLMGRLLKGRDEALSRIPPGQPYVSAVSHTRTPGAPLVFGRVYPYVERRLADAEGLLAQFDDRGVRPYRPGRVDYAKTHFANHANGHGAAELANVLEAATLSGDAALIERSLALLDKQTALYANTVPRGAQVWEVPLHTPDILASAHLVKAYTLGYMLSGRQAHLEQARYWAWTGVPFVYLVNPTEGQVGPYATIAVLGATNWQAPSWFGRPVQWCGLVYGSALHLLSRYDNGGPWERIAKGITASGLQMTWPTSDEKRQGLLPDFFHLREQRSDGPAINPGSVQTHVPELFGRGTLYDVRKLSAGNCFIHAPCAIRDLLETPQAITFTLDGWGDKTFYILLSGIERPPADITIRPIRAPGPDAVRAVHADAGPRLPVLAIPLDGPAQIRIRF